MPAWVQIPPPAFLGEPHFFHFLFLEIMWLSGVVQARSNPASICPEARLTIINSSSLFYYDLSCDNASRKYLLKGTAS